MSDGCGCAPDPPVRSRGVIALVEENCTVCMLCARECPDWCIVIESHTEPLPPIGPRGRPRSRNVLDRFALDFSLCMYCGICVEACPFDALLWSPEHEYAAGEPSALVHEREQLRDWVQGVPAPEPDDPRGDPPAEVVVSDKAASRRPR
jgi:NADH-quinone oxidoreductase subunit I